MLYTVSQVHSAHSAHGANTINLHWEEPDDAAPAKADTAAIEERHVETICPFANLLEDLEVIVGQTFRESTLACLGLSGLMSISVQDRDLFLKRILTRPVRDTVCSWLLTVKGTYYRVDVLLG
jgi:hypothetical protein